MSVEGTLIAKKCVHKSPKQLSVSRNYSDYPETNFRLHIRVLFVKTASGPSFT